MKRQTFGGDFEEVVILEVIDKLPGEEAYGLHVGFDGTGYIYSHIATGLPVFTKSVSTPEEAFQTLKDIVVRKLPALKIQNFLAWKKRTGFYEPKEMDKFSTSKIQDMYYKEPRHVVMKALGLSYPQELYNILDGLEIPRKTRG